MEEIAPGIVRWTARHPNLGVEVSSYLLVEEGVALDPMVPPEGLDALREHGEVAHVVLTNRHHDRDSAHFAEAFSCPVHVVRQGLHEYEGKDLQVTPFDFCDELPGGLRAHAVYDEWPDEGAIEVPSVRALAIADGTIRYGEELGFVPDEHLGDDPDETKRGLREGYARLADQVEPEILLLAHGSPVIGGGADALRRFAQQP